MDGRGVGTAAEGMPLNGGPLQYKVLYYDSLYSRVLSQDSRLKTLEPRVCSRMFILESEILDSFMCRKHRVRLSYDNKEQRKGG